MNLINNIKSYILFLKRELGLYISLHPYGNESVITQSELITFNIHDNPYCACVKGCADALGNCINKQARVREKCKEGAFFGTCFAGVFEFVYPIISLGEYFGFISVSGYKSENYKSYIKRISKKYNIPENSLISAYSHLKDTLPEKSQLDTLIMPLCNMLELAYIKSQSNSKKAESRLDTALRYIKQFHTQNITLNDLAHHLGCSRSSLSHTFKAELGKSFREYLTDLRINDAKSLLRYSALTVTEIAFSVGFSDSAYFSLVFKKSVGSSPTEYRKSHTA